MGASYLDEWMVDVVGVMDEVGSESVALIGVDTASPMALILAAAFPERVRALVLFETYARLTSTPGYEIGHPPEISAIARDLNEASWGEGGTTVSMVTDAAGDPYLEDVYGRLERASMSRTEAAHAISSWFDLDVREVLSSVIAPALLFHGSRNPLVQRELGLYVAEHLRSARFIEYRSRSLHGWAHSDHFPISSRTLSRRPSGWPRLVTANGEVRSKRWTTGPGNAFGRTAADSSKARETVRLRRSMAPPGRSRPRGKSSRQRGSWGSR
jgi:pimeloyl-ACP methyl ester carboxylesterase